MWWEGGGVCFFQTHCREQGSLFLVILAMYSTVMGRGYVSFRLIVENKDHYFSDISHVFKCDGKGGGVCFFQTHCREHVPLFLVILAMYSNVMGRGGRVCFFQTHCREQGSLFLVILAMYSNVMGRAGMFLSDSL